jgi:hypothetical protein
MPDLHPAVGDVRGGPAGAEHRDVVAVRGDARVDLLAVPGDATLGLGQLERTDHCDLHRGRSRGRVT